MAVQGWRHKLRAKIYERLGKKQKAPADCDTVLLETGGSGEWAREAQKIMATVQGS